MIKIKVKEDRTPVEYDYSLSSLADLEEKMKSIYKPVIGVYKIGLTLNELSDIKFLLNNKSKVSHLDLDLILTESMYKKVSLAIPTLVQEDKKGMWDYLIEGISKRGLLIEIKVVSLIYSSVGKSYEEIDDILDLLYDNFGSYLQINSKDLSKHLVINNITYPRTVLISYINLTRWRKTQLHKCLNDISPDIVLASMVKQVKKLHKQKLEYLKTGLGNKFVRELNTRNLNLMYYTLTVNKPYHLNDITILLEMYERGINIE